MALTPFIMNYRYPGSLSKSFDQIQIEIYLVNVYEPLDDSFFIDHYELSVRLKYLRLFSEYFGELRVSDSDYLTSPPFTQWYEHPQDIEPDWTGSLQDDLICDWSYCKPLSEWYGNELWIQFRVTRYNIAGIPWGYQESGENGNGDWFGDDEDYHDIIIYNFETYNGALGIFFKVIPTNQ